MFLGDNMKILNIYANKLYVPEGLLVCLVFASPRDGHVDLGVDELWHSPG